MPTPKHLIEDPLTNVTDKDDLHLCLCDRSRSDADSYSQALLSYGTLEKKICVAHARTTEKQRKKIARKIAKEISRKSKVD